MKQVLALAVFVLFGSPLGCATLVYFTRDQPIEVVSTPDGATAKVREIMGSEAVISSDLSNAGAAERPQMLSASQIASAKVVHEATTPGTVLAPRPFKGNALRMYAVTVEKDGYVTPPPVMLRAGGVNMGCVVLEALDFVAIVPGLVDLVVGGSCVDNAPTLIKAELVASAAARDAAATTNHPRHARVKIGSLNIRATPSASGRLLGSANGGEDVEVLDDSAKGGWLRIRTKQGIEGYCAAKYLDRSP